LNAVTDSGGATTSIVSPNADDAELAVELLSQAGMQARAFGSMRELAQTLDDRTGCLILVEEALLEDELPLLRDALARLPAWCDLPLIVVSRDVGTLGFLTAAAFPHSGNVTLLERPLNPHTLASAVQVALRASARQREVGELIGQREQAVKLRDEFLAMLAHELRNPLAPMRNALYIMRAHKIDDPLILKNAEILDRQVNHMVRMVDDLMDVARLERGKVALKKQRADLNRVVAAAVESCLPAAQQRGHHVSVHYGANALPVDGDAVRIEQIICNLINNAAKFSPQPGEIRVETAVESGRALVMVEDRGIGFEPGAAENLFDPFLQVNPTLERTAGGLGIGLTIVKRLAELHGGSVHAASAGSGKGSRFIVRLPLATGLEPPASEAARPPAATRRCRVVIIEDNPDIRETLRTLVTMWGHSVALASDGNSGVELVLQQRPDVALIDVGLPGMNGYEVARAIRRTIPNGDIRLIAVTGYGQPSDRDTASQAGFDTHLLKPIAPEVLRELLGG
jgi:signal transduction histidine kinase